MKKYNKLFCLLTLLFVFSNCKKEDVQPTVLLGNPEFYAGSKEFGFASGAKNDLQFEASAFARFHQGNHSYVGIDISTFSIEGFLREYLHFNEIPVKVGSFEIKGNSHDTNDGYIGAEFSKWESDGDLLTGFYHIDSTSVNILNVEKIDTFAKNIIGRLNATFVKDPISSTTYPEIVHFKDVKFNMSLIE